MTRTSDANTTLLPPPQPLAASEAPARAPNTAVARRLRWSRAAGLAGLGACAAALASLAASSAQSSGSVDAPVRVWAADRDGQRVVGLDGNLIAVREIPIGWPLAVEARDDGGLWVLRSGNATSSFGMRLTSFSARFEQENETYLERASDLALIDGRDALAIENGVGASGADRLWRIAPDGHSRLLLEHAALVCVAPFAAGEVLVATANSLVRLEIGAVPRVLARASLTLRCVDLAPGPRPGTSFVLDVGPPCRLLLIGSDLAPLWSAAVGFEAHEIVGVPGAERAWLGDAIGARARRFGPGGALERDLVLSMLAPEHGVEWLGGGALFATPGAVLRIDSQGQALPGQGGFQWLSDLARAH